MTPGPAIVALGGGHGLAASLQALRRVTDRLTAVVTVGDDGGSSGRLREEFDCLPPGDLRMALAALCGDDEWGQLWSGLAQHRFTSTGQLDGHAVGNLLIVGLWQLLGDPVAALDQVGRLLGAHGRVLPMSREPVGIAATVAFEGDPVPRVVRGQVAVATTTGQVAELRLEPAVPVACEEAVRAIDEADWVVLGPGSWFTSVLPNVMVPGLREALVRTAARRLVVLNLSPQQGETTGFSAGQYLEVLAAHAPDLAVDVVLADPRTVSDPGALRRVAARVGADLVLEHVARSDDPLQHDPQALAGAYSRLLERGRIGAWQ